MIFGQNKEELFEKATARWQRGYQAHLRGEYDEAIRLYTHSIELCPTAEAYTFRGWAMSFQGKLDEAIEECRRAITVDPEFGNPYNDIGAYLIEQGNYYSAIPWLQQATEAKRYDCYFYPWCNLGRIYERQNRLIEALNCYRRACELKPDYLLAVRNFRRLQAIMN